jgi:hypothetical protein
VADVKLAEVPGPVRLASAVVGLEAVALLVGAVFLLIDSIVGNPNSVSRALLDAAAALLGAVVLGLCTRGLLRLHPAARTPVVVLEILAIPVGYDIAFPAGRVAIGAPILFGALAVLYLLFTPPARAALDREISR